MGYNKSEIMKRAWEIKNENSKNIFSICLKMAWAEAKKPAEKSKKEILIEKLTIITNEAGSHDNGYHYSMNVAEWNNYGKSRTYFSITETRDGSKHYKKKGYGYFNNQTGEYVPDRYGDLTENYTFSETKMR